MAKVPRIPFYKDGVLLHSQIRIGRGRKPIVITKIRTMPRDAHADFDTNGAREKKTTSFGRVLRRTKLDEVPQLLNVMRKEMNIVELRVKTRRTFSRLPKDIQAIYEELGPGLLCVSYSLPRSERTRENIFAQYRKFYEDYKNNKTKAVIEHVKRILANWTK